MADNNSTSQHTIIRNTGALYIRTIITMLISLYTSRLVLQLLGVDDFGLYGVVGGVVVMFAFLNSSMMSAIQRFLNFELGAGNYNAMNNIFSVGMTGYLGAMVFIFILAQTVGLWFLNYEMNIGEQRVFAANVVYQFSLLTCFAQMLRIPYNATIIAYEKMSFYAYTSIFEALIKLLFIYLLYIVSVDKLMLYSALMFLATLIITLIYRSHCKRHFDTCNFIIVRDGALYRKVLHFSGWSLCGSAANVGTQQGTNLMLNIFNGLEVNAAMGIANQVSGAVYSFTSSFQTAFNPQLIKTYAAGKIDYFNRMIAQTSKFSYYLLFIISLPVIISSEFILSKWLTVVPDYAALFCQLMIITMLIEAVSAPLWIAAQAIGDIKVYQIVISVLIAINLPLSYLLLKLGFSPASVLGVRVVIGMSTLTWRLLYLNAKINLNILLYIKNVLFKIAVVTLLAIPVPIMIRHTTAGWNGFILTSAVSLLLCAAIIYSLGINRNEREFLKETAHKLINKYNIR